jgi:DNA polymerase I
MAKIYPKNGMVGSLFSGHHEETNWKAPTELPSLANYPENARFGFDTEYESGSVFKARLAGMSICTPDKRKFFFPVGFAGGGNLDPNSIRRWANKELANKHLCILNAKGDNEVCKNWGLDFEAIGSKLIDPAFKAALIDENRRKFNLNILLEELCGRSKAEIPGSKADISNMSASEVGSYAEQDAEDHLDVDLAQQVEIDKQDLNRVCDLEDQLIYPTSAMERKAALIDRPKLERWVHEVSMAHQAAILEIYRTTGFKINPNSGKDLARVFHHFNIPIPVREEELGGGETFEEEYMGKVDHPTIRLIIAARKLDSLNTKYLKKYLKNLDSNNILRYNLHQLRNDEFGTVTGRYASAAPKEGGCNIQQVMKVESQLEQEAIAAWIVRELFIPETGKVYVSADASQIEFRWFAHYSKSERLIREYNEDPTMDFHQLVANMLGQKRKDAKHNNFGKLYTMGIPKLARKLGLSCTCGCGPRDQWNRANHLPDCRIHKAFLISKEYDEKFPEAKKLSNEAMKIAKERGYVRSAMGGRRRYPTGERLHSALNAIIQRTAAETLKVKLLESYRHRVTLALDLRATVHDELDGDQDPDPIYKKRFKELLEEPDSRIPCRVPLLWQVETGPNWKVCTE